MFQVFLLFFYSLGTKETARVDAGRALAQRPLGKRWGRRMGELEKEPADSQEAENVETQVELGR